MNWEAIFKILTIIIKIIMNVISTIVSAQWKKCNMPALTYCFNIDSLDFQVIGFIITYFFVMLQLMKLGWLKEKCYILDRKPAFWHNSKIILHVHSRETHTAPQETKAYTFHLFAILCRKKDKTNPINYSLLLTE